MVHIYPINEIEDHILIGTGCKCLPIIKIYNISYYSKKEDLVIHNAFDVRKIYGYYKKPRIIEEIIK